MLEFYAKEFVHLSVLLEDIRLNIDNLGVQQIKEVSPFYRGVLHKMREHCSNIGLTYSIKGIDRISTKLIEEQILSTEIKHDLRSLRERVFDELDNNFFLVIPRTKAQYYHFTHPLFDVAISKAFPDSWDDVWAAGRCFALDEWTACVFHLMRVAEHGLRSLADRIGVTFASPPELENWKNIIDLIEKKIKELEALPKSVKKSEDLKFYSDAAVQFRYFKDAWRNHVSHSRENYDERKASSVLDHVLEFMRELASRP
ncbi:MAG TPA: hypothetical protein VGJ48_25375 [Pyrinomonadaceae bacterium]